MMFNDETGTVTFKSQSSFFEKERNNRKCFTVRMMTSDEWDQFWSFVARHDDQARIEIQEACMVPINSFTRWITDVAWEPRWGGYEVCISWRDERVEALYSAFKPIFENGVILPPDEKPALEAIALVENPHEYYNELDAQKKLVGQLSDALRRLYDEQNDAPLEKYREDWNKAMKGAEEALKAARA